jgi:homoserine kinase
MNEIKIFCPATIANLSCGFDVLGLADNVGWNDCQKPIKSSSLNCGCRFTIGNRNVAGVAGLALLDAVETDFGFDIEIYKT